VRKAVDADLGETNIVQAHTLRKSGFPVAFVCGAKIVPLSKGSCRGEKGKGEIASYLGSRLREHY